jgi:hypothetical protein
MAHFAQVINGIVQEVIVAEQDYIDSLPDANLWLQTSYNTRGGIHYEPNSSIPSPDQSKAVRKNYASVGFTYDTNRNAFIPPQPYPSWLLDEFSCLWNAPVPYPIDGKRYEWDETIINWVEIT